LFGLLPGELVEKVFSFLPTLGDFEAVARTCKGFLALAGRPLRERIIADLSFFSAVVRLQESDRRQEFDQRMVSYILTEFQNATKPKNDLCDFSSVRTQILIRKLYLSEILRRNIIPQLVHHRLKTLPPL